MNSPNTLQHLWSWLSGKKTYAVALTGVLYTYGVQKGLWPHNVLFDTALGAGGLSALRSGLKAEAQKIALAVISDPPTLPAVTTTTTSPPK